MGHGGKNYQIYGHFSVCYTCDFLNEIALGFVNLDLCNIDPIQTLTLYLVAK